MTEESTFTISDLPRFTVGDSIVINDAPRWWVRLWRWITRYKPPVYEVKEIDRANSAITLRSEKESKGGVKWLTIFR